MENKTLRTTLKVFSIVSVILGAAALLEGSTDSNIDALIGGAFILAEGWLALAFISKN